MSGQTSGRRKHVPGAALEHSREHGWIVLFPGTWRGKVNRAISAGHSRSNGLDVAHISADPHERQRLNTVHLADVPQKTNDIVAGRDQRPGDC